MVGGRRHDVRRHLLSVARSVCSALAAICIVVRGEFPACEAGKSMPPVVGAGDCRRLRVSSWPRSQIPEPSLEGTSESEC